MAKRGSGGGGRGGIQSGGGIRVTTKDGTVFEYRDRGKGIITSFTDIREKNVGNLSLNQIAERMQKNGASVEVFSESKLNAMEKKTNAEIYGRMDYEYAYGTARKNARASRLASKAARRKNR